MFRIAMVLPLVVVAVVVGGCGNKGVSAEAKRAQDRQLMQVEDLTNQRNALQSELTRVKQANAELQKNLTSSQQQLDQARTELGRARGELQSALASRQQMEVQKTELDALKRQLEQLKGQINAAAPAPAPETRTVTPSTQPNVNK